MPYFNYGRKNVYFEVHGSGYPLVMLHGNSVSSKLFEVKLSLYTDSSTVVLIDFLGHGKSDRLDSFPVDFWYDQAIQTKQLITTLGFDKANIIGTSGGALTALNLALEYPTLVNKVIADSFEGDQAIAKYAMKLPEARRKTKTLKDACMFWEYCHGHDWEQVVDSDTDVIVRHYNEIKNFFHKDLSEIKVPTMLTASLEDDEYSDIIDIGKTYSELSNKSDNITTHLFPLGRHPAMLTSAEEFAKLAIEFFYN